MLSNFHTHTVFCDGKNTPEEIVTAALEKGFTSIGFSAHGYTAFDLRYCIKDCEGYIAEVNRLKETYKKEIQIYLGLEEDAFYPADRSKFDYIIGSSHYFHVEDRYYPIDSNYDYFKKCLAVFGYDICRLTDTYYRAFCSYIHARKPDIIGHFDLITKFDELDASLFLQNPAYQKLAAAYTAEAAKSGCLFEVNTGAIARGYRTAAYPDEPLLYILKQCGAGLILASDSHQSGTLDYGFAEAKARLREIGFTKLYTLYNGAFVPYDI